MAAFNKLNPLLHAKEPSTFIVLDLPFSTKCHRNTTNIAHSHGSGHGTG
jgi:hypothetical protein